MNWLAWPKKEMPMLPSVEWLPLTWEAVATFVTGMAAVGGATFIGRRQTRISERQIEIQSWQGSEDRRIRSNQLKLELLDRRANCIEQMRKVSGVLWANGELGDDERLTLFLAIRDAELIFQADVVEGLSQVSQAALKARFARSAQQRAYERGDEAMAERWDKKAAEREEYVLDNFDALIESMIEHSRLHDVS